MVILMGSRFSLPLSMGCELGLFDYPSPVESPAELHPLTLDEPDFLFPQTVNEAMESGVYDGVDRDLDMHPFIAIPMPGTPDTFINQLTIDPPEGNGDIVRVPMPDSFMVKSLPMSSSLHSLTDDVVVLKVVRTVTKDPKQSRPIHLKNLRRELKFDEVILPSFIYHNLKMDRRCRMAVKIVEKKK